MLNVSSKLRDYTFSPQAGVLALVEFLLVGLSGQIAAALARRGAQSTAALFYIVSLTSLLFFIIHSVVAIKRRRWEPWFSLLAVVVIFFLAQSLAGLLVSLYPALKGWSLARITLWLDNSIKAQFAYLVFAGGLTLAAVYGYMRTFGIKLAAIGLRRPRWSDLAYGLIAAPIYFFIYLLTVAVISHFVPTLDVNQSQQLGFDNVHGAFALSLAFVSLVILPPLTEEILMRGLLYTSLKKAMPVIYAGVLTSALFAVAHLPEGGSGGPLYIAAIDTFILSLALVYLREKTDGLWSSMTLHAVKNGIAFVALFVVHLR